MRIDKNILELVIYMALLNLFIIKCLCISYILCGEDGILVGK